MEYVAVELGGRMGNIALKCENEKDAMNYIKLSSETEKKALEQFFEFTGNDTVTIKLEKSDDEKEVLLFWFDEIIGIEPHMMSWHVMPLKEFIKEVKPNVFVSKDKKK